MYEGAEETPVVGGTISEAIIGNFPHLNPLLPSTGYNAYINSILYRSLLRYDTKEQKIQSDLASCDISNLSLIECYLENNIKWSDGRAITEDDIIATLNLIEKSNINPGISSLLENTTIEKWNGKITFNNTKKDINFLNVLFQPIIPQTLVNSLWEDEIEGKFSPIGGIYSGAYTLSSVNQDDTVGITVMTLTKNSEYFQNDAFVDTILLKLFRDNAHFLKHKNSINIFNDKENILGDTVPRLKSYAYTLPQFVWLFLNQESLSSENLRKFVLSNINREEVVKSLWSNNVETSYNPFLTDTQIDVGYDAQIQDLIAKEGYLSKTQLLEIQSRERQQAIQSQQTISAEASIPKIVQANLSYVVSPSNQKYNFISEDNVLITGNVPSGVDAVYVNEYKLQWFSEGDDVFYYRLLESYDSITEWENTYKVFFERSGTKELVDEFVYTYFTDSEKLSRVRSEFDNQGNTIVAPNPTSITSQSTDESALLNLDDRFYYTSDTEVFKIRILYVESDKNITETALEIKKQLEEKGIFVELVAESLVNITRGLRDETLEYDGVLIGINLWYFDSNVFPYFHSSQIKNGYNFANYKQLGLDILLEELKSNNLSLSKKEELTDKILEILKESVSLKVLYTPKIRLLVDRNLEWFSLGEILPDEIHRFDPLKSTYLTKKKIISKENKWLKDFWKFIFSSLTGTRSNESE